MNEPEPTWLSDLRAAAQDAGRTRRPGHEVVRGSRPPLFDADAARALLSCLLAAFVIAAAIFRARVAPVSFDLLALLLRTASVAFCVRALIALVTWLRRLRAHWNASAHLLAWCPEGILWRAPEGEHWAAKEDLLGVALPESSRTSLSAPPAPQPLVLVRHPEGGTLRRLALPPYFAASQEVLATRLNHWLGREDQPPASRFEPPRASPEERYARIVRGQCEAGEAQIPEGLGFVWRAPYGVLLGCVFAADAVRSAGPLAARVAPAAGAACVLALVFLVGWLLWMQRRRRSRLGIALALTREEILLRGRAGTLSVPWGQLSNVEVSTRLAWSPFLGSYLVRLLWLFTTEGERIVFDQGFLGVPAEEVAVLCEAYRRREV